MFNRNNYVINYYALEEVGCQFFRMALAYYRAQTYISCTWGYLTVSRNLIFVLISEGIRNGRKRGGKLASIK